MTAEPFPHHKLSSDLEASTAITPVTPELMDHAAQHAADLLVEAARNASGQSGKGGRNRKRIANEAPGYAEVGPIARSQPNAVAENEREASNIVDQTAPVAMIPADSSAETQSAASADFEPATHAGDTLAQLQAKAAEAVRTNIDAAFGFWRSMIGVMSLAEVASMNASHIREQLETYGEQGRELASLAQRLAQELLSRFTPFR